MLAITGLQAAEDLSGMFKEGKVSGEIRAFHIDRKYDGWADAVHRNGTALGGHLKFETADYEGLSLGTAFYTTNRILRSLEHTVVEPALFGKGNVSQNTLGEAYVKYTNGNTTFVGGRQKLDTPLAGSDDCRMTPNFFEAYMLTNTSLENTTLTLGQLTKFASGTFANIYSAGGILAATGGYSAIDNSDQGQFTNMGEYATGVATDGVTLASAVYKNKGMKLQAWDYYSHDIVNSLFLQADMSYKDVALKPSIGVQVIKENSVGDKLIGNALGGNGKIDSLYWGVKAGVKYDKFGASIAYSETGENSDTDNAYANAIITNFGGMPAYTQGMVTRHMFLAGTKATKAVVSYADDFAGTNVSLALYHTMFDMDKNNGYTTSETAQESGFDLKIKPAAVKNLLVRLRGNFPTNFKDLGADGAVNWAEYRFIVSYKF